MRFAQPRGLGLKVSDEFTVPLCRGHHRELHRSGLETVWWANAGIEPIIIARRLWTETHPLPGQVSASSPGEDDAATDSAVGGNVVEAIPQKPGLTQITKRTQLPDLPT